MRLFSRIQRKRMGVTKDNVERILLAMDKDELIEDEPTEVLAMEVMTVLQGQNPDEWCEANDAGMDWDSLLEFISKLIEMLMPFIVKSRPVARVNIPEARGR